MTTSMTTLWVCIAVTAVASFTIKAVGPAVLGNRRLPERAAGVIALSAPVLLVALVVADLLGRDWADFDATAVAGVAAAAVARWRGLPLLLAVFSGVAVTALLRLAT
jgi:branched-subunit amino acid transport protein